MLVMNAYHVAVATTLILLAAAARGQPQVPCFFIFGDSLSDSGNNNPLVSTAKANYPPYGIDFPEGPTGRFCNGRTTVDLIGDHLGLDSYIKAFPSITPEEMVKGVNYASGSAGILDDTGAMVGERVPMAQQLQNHQTTISKITEILGKDKVQDHLSKCLYSVYAGSNDYMLNWLMSKSTTMTPEQFTDSIIPRYTEQIKTLYRMGARKVAVFGLSPLGCMPLLRVTGQCSAYINDILDQMFNSRVRSIVDEFNHNFTDAQFIYVNSMKIITPDLSALGLEVLDVPCCGVADTWCVAYSSPCLNRNEYAYWDDAHPTEAANKVLANGAYSARDPEDCYPMDIQHLVGASSTADQR